jgi:enediyne biosynthesis protein E4
MRNILGATLAAALCVVQPALAQSPAVPSFVDETAGSGIDSVYDGDWFFIVGGGVAAFDCNDDGFADLVLPGGSGTAKLYRNTSAKGGALTFVPETSGVELDDVTGAYPADIDSDGITDLVVLRSGENVIMRGLGACKFERANEAWGFDGGDAWSTALAATWEKGAAWPTVAVGNYVDRKEEISPWGSCTDNWLHRGGDGKFAAPLPLQPSFCALSMLFTDWNRSGTPSLRVSNDREYYEGGQEQMWTLTPGAEPTLLTEADGWKRLRIWGMGIASYDLDGDGFPEYFLTSMADNKLQTLATPAEGATPDYKDVAFARGVTAERPYFGEDRKPSTAWHAQFEDVNNDGLVDLFVAKGNVDRMPDFATRDPNNLLLQTADGKFIESGEVAGIANNGSARGAALVDFNMDGLLDLVVVNRRAGAQVWRNASTEPGNWIEFRLQQPAPNVDATGAWLEVRRADAVMRRELTIGGGHAGGHLGWVHFGLGGEATTSVSVVWPDGSRSEWADLAANGFYLLDRDKPAAPFTPRD